MLRSTFKVKFCLLCLSFCEIGSNSKKGPTRADRKQDGLRLNNIGRLEQIFRFGDFRSNNSTGHVGMAGTRSRSVVLEAPGFVNAHNGANLGPRPGLGICCRSRAGSVFRGNKTTAS